MAIVYAQQGITPYNRTHEEIHDSKSIETRGSQTRGRKETLEVMRVVERDRLKERERDAGGDQLFCHVCTRIQLHFPTIPRSCLEARFVAGGIQWLSGNPG